MKRIALRLAAVAVVLAAVGLGLWWTKPDLGAAWARLANLTRGVGASAAEDRPEIDAPPEPSSAGRRPRADLADPRFASTLGVATCGASEASHEPWPAVVLSSPEVAARIGLETAPSLGRRHTPTITGNAEVVYNANLYGEVRPRVAGIVREVIADEGSHLKPGETMLVIDSATVGSAKAEYLAALPSERLAQQTYDMTMSLRRDNAAPLKDELTARAELNRAKAAVLNARQRLKNLGFKDPDLARIAAEQDTSTLLDVVSPLEGVVVDRHAVPGEAVEPTDRVFVVANIHLMWAWIDVYESDVDRVAIGQRVWLTIAGTESPVFDGHVDWIDAAVNPATRTIRVRAEIGNPTDRLRANAFGLARIQVGPERDAVFVPKEAVQTVESRQFVFVPLGGGRYRPRPVVTATSGDRRLVEVVSGLAPGVEVVTTGAFLLKSEMIRQQDASAE